MHYLLMLFCGFKLKKIFINLIIVNHFIILSCAFETETELFYLGMRHLINLMT